MELYLRIQKYLFFFFLFSFAATQVIAQSKRANNWYFNHLAGIDFNRSPAVPVSNGKVNNSSFTGSACISDEDGNLLFYTDSYLVWNRNHEQMSNGFDITSGRVNTTTQTSVIVPKPGTNNLYYIFTVNPYNNPVDNGLFYAEVDMNLNNGFGDVTKKNQPLYNPVANGLTAVKHANGQDYWVIVNAKDTYNILSYKVTADGVTTQPVVSRTAIQTDWLTGQMKASPDGSWLAVMTGRTVELSNFNAATGRIENAHTLIEHPYHITFFDGLEFSPNSSILYVSTSERQFYQYNLVDPNQDVIKASLIKLPGADLNQHADMQLGPDGKIYVAKGGGYDWGPTSLGVINNPNQMGAQANYQEDGFVLGGRKTGSRLPAFVTSFLAAPAAISYSNLCYGDETFFSSTGIGSRDALRWDFGDPASGASNTSSELAATHTFSAPGTYTVTLQVYLGDMVKTLEQQVTIYEKPAVNLGPDIKTCIAEAVTLDAGSGRTYRWSTGETTQTIQVNSSGNYWVEVSNGFCVAKDEVQVELLAQPTLNLGPDQEICENITVVLSVGEENSNYSIRWSTGETTPTIGVNKSGLYWVEVTNEICTVRDEVRVDFRYLSDYGIAYSKNTLQNNEAITVEVLGEEPVAWQWDFGDGYVSNNKEVSHIYDTAGNYTITLTATNTYGCSSKKSFPVVVAPYLFIPNIFTPNNDGKNDNFKVKYNGRGLFEVHIYNRWGKEVYQADHKDFKWSGAGAADGVYLYLIKTETGTYRGSVTLVK